MWHAPLGVRIAKRRHQSPEWTILSHSYRLIQGEIVRPQVLLDSLHPCSTRTSWWSFSVFFHFLDIFIIQPVSRSYFGHSGAKPFTSVVKILQHSCLKQTWLFNISSTNVNCLISRVLLRINSLMPHFVFANVSVHTLWVKMLTHFVRKSLMWGTIGQSLCGHVSCEICLLPFCMCHIFSFFFVTRICQTNNKWTTFKRCCGDELIGQIILFTQF